MPAALVGLIASFGVPGLVTAGGALTTVGSLVAGGIGLGLSYAASLFNQPKAMKPNDVKTILRQSVLPRRKSYGLVQEGGGYVFYRSREGSAHLVIYHGEGPSFGVDEHIVDGRPVTLDANGYVQQDPYDGQMRIQFRLGAPLETGYPDLVAKYPDILNVNFRGDRCISTFVTAGGVKPEKFSSVYPNRLPVYERRARNGSVLDPRTGTRGWSQNLILIFREYLVDRDGAGVLGAYVDNDDFKAPADNADELLSTNGGGTVRRYHGQLAYDLTTAPEDIVKRLQTVTDARLYLKPNGKIGIHPGKWVEPSVRIHDGCISSYELTDSSGPLREANEITLSYTNPLAGFTEAACDPWRDEDDISSTGQTKTMPIEAYEIQHHHHGRRVQKLAAMRASARWQGTIVTDLWGLKARNSRFIKLEVQDLGIDFENFEIEDYSEDDENMQIVMKVRSVTGAGMYDLTSAEEGTPPPIPPAVDDNELDPPQNLVVLGTQRAMNGQTKVAVITASWSAYPGRKDLTAKAEISKADANVWRAMQMDDSDTKAEAIGLEDGALYDVRVSWLKPAGTPSPYSLVENVQAIADPARPATPTSLQTTISGTVVTVSARAGNDNTAYLLFKRGTTTQTFDQATDISGEVRVSANQVIYIDDTPGPGTWRYWARAKNGSGVVNQTNAGPVTRTVS